MVNNFQNDAQNNNQEKKRPDWYYGTAKYATPSLPKAVFQLFDTFIPYFALWAVMIFFILRGFPYWITLLLSVVAAGLLVRIFILFHDCCHHSFFASRLANKICGHICGVFTCTPYSDWQWTHSRHHATAADLDRRGFGSVWTMTVSEYLAAPWFTRLRYRIFRNPFIMFGIGSLIMFLFVNRFPTKGVGSRQRISVLVTNIAIVILFLAAGFFLGFWSFIKIATPIIIIASTTGVWLFYIQHQFEGVYWARHDEWDIMTASLKGCSYYKLPNVLHWFTANIGIHHVHHLRTAIPNYNLQKCYNETPQVQDINQLTIRKSLKSLHLNLWDEQSKKLVSFRSIRKLTRQTARLAL